MRVAISMTAFIPVMLILGLNLIYAAFHEFQTPELFLEGVAENLDKRIEIDHVDLRGPTFEMWDHRALAVERASL